MRRLFVGLALPEDVRTRFEVLCSGLANARWVPQENLHLTLRFIGDVGEDAAEDIDDALREIRIHAFSMRLYGLGFFGNRRTPRQLWVGVEPAPALLRLQGKVAAAVLRAGLPPEGRKLVPHVTFARLRDVQASRLAAFLSMHELFCVDAFPVERFTLYSSKLSHSGPIYRAEADYPLDSEAI